MNSDELQELLNTVRLSWQERGELSHSAALLIAAIANVRENERRALDVEPDVGPISLLPGGGKK